MLGAKKLLRSMQPGAATWLDWDEHAEEDLQGPGEGLGEGHLSGIFHDDAAKALNFRSRRTDEAEKVYKALIFTETEKLSNSKIKKNMNLMLNLIIDVFNLTNSKKIVKTSRPSETDVKFYQRKISEMKTNYGEVRNYVNALYRKAWYFYEKQNKLPANEMDDRIIFARLGGLVFDDSNNVMNKDDAEYAASSDEDDIDISTGLPKKGIKLPTAATAAPDPSGAAAGPTSDSSGAAAVSAPNPPAPNPGVAGPPASQPADAAGAGPPAPNPAGAGPPAPNPAGAGPPAPNPAGAATVVPGPNSAGSSAPAPATSSGPPAGSGGPPSASGGPPSVSGGPSSASGGPPDSLAPAPGSSAVVEIPYPFTKAMDSARPEAQMLVAADFPFDKTGDFTAYSALMQSLFSVSKSIETCEEWFLSILEDYDIVTTKFTQMASTENFQDFATEIKTVFEEKYNLFDNALKAWKVDTDNFSKLVPEIERLKPNSADPNLINSKVFKHLSYISFVYNEEIEKKQKTIKIFHDFKQNMLNYMEQAIQKVIEKKNCFPVDVPFVLDQSNFDTKDQVKDVTEKIEKSVAFFKKIDSIVQFYKTLLQDIATHCSDTNVLSQTNIVLKVAFTFKLQSENKDDINKKIEYYGNLAIIFENWLKTQITVFENTDSEYKALDRVWTKNKTWSCFSSLIMEKLKPFENFNGMKILSFVQKFLPSQLTFPPSKTLYEIIIDGIENIFSEFGISSAVIEVYFLTLGNFVRNGIFSNDFEVFDILFKSISLEQNKKTDNSVFNESDWENAFTKYFKKCFFKDNFLSIPMSVLQRVFPATPMIEETFLKCFQKQFNVESRSEDAIKSEIQNTKETPTDTYTKDMIEALKTKIINMLLAKKSEEKNGFVIKELESMFGKKADSEEICDAFVLTLLQVCPVNPQNVDTATVKPPCDTAKNWIDEKTKLGTDMTNFENLSQFTEFLLKGCELAAGTPLIQSDDTPNVIQELLWIQSLIKFAFEKNLLKTKCDYFVLKTLQYVTSSKATFDDFDDAYLVHYFRLMYSVLTEKKVLKLKTDDPPLFDDETPVDQYVDKHLNKTELKKMRATYAPEKWALEVFPPATTIVVTQADLANYIVNQVTPTGNVSEDISKIQAAVQACVVFFNSKKQEGNADFSDAVAELPAIFVDKLQLKEQTIDSGILLYIQIFFGMLHSREDFPSAGAEIVKKDWVKSQFISTCKECLQIDLSDAEKEKGVAFWDWFALCYNLNGLGMYDSCAPELWDWVFETDLPKVLMPEVTLTAEEVAKNFEKNVSSVQYAARKVEYDGKISDVVNRTVSYNDLDRTVTVSVDGENQQKKIKDIVKSINEQINEIYCFDKEYLDHDYTEMFVNSLESVYNFFDLFETATLETKLTTWISVLNLMNVEFLDKCNFDIKQCIDNIKNTLITVDDFQDFSTFISILQSMLLKENLLLFYLQSIDEDDENKIKWESFFDGSLQFSLENFKKNFPEKFVCLNEKIRLLFDSFEKLEALKNISAKITNEFKDLLESCNAYSIDLFLFLEYLLAVDYEDPKDVVKQEIINIATDDVLKKVSNNTDEKENLSQQFEWEESLDINVLVHTLSNLEFYGYVKENLIDRKNKSKYPDANVIVFLDWTMDIEKTTGLHDPFTFTVGGSEEVHQKSEQKCSDDLLERSDVLISFFEFVKAYLSFLKFNWMDDDTRRKHCAAVIKAIEETKGKLALCKTLDKTEQAWLYLWITYYLFSIDNSEFLYDLFVQMFGKNSVPGIFLQSVTDVSSIDLKTDSAFSVLVKDHQQQLQELEQKQMTTNEDYINGEDNLLSFDAKFHEFEQQRQNLEDEETQLVTTINFFTFVQKHITSEEKQMEIDIKIFFETFFKKMTEYIRTHDAYVQIHQHFNEKLTSVFENFVSNAVLVSRLFEKTCLSVCKSVRYCENITDLRNKIKDVSTEDQDLPSEPLYMSIDKEDKQLNAIIMDFFFVYNFDFKQIPENDKELEIDEPVSLCLNKFSMLYYASLKYKTVFAADPAETLPQKMKWPFQVFLLTGIADVLEASVDKNVFWDYHMDDDTKNALGNKTFDELYQEGLREHAQNKLRFTLDPNFGSNTENMKNSSNLLQELANDRKTAAECAAPLQQLSDGLGKEVNNFVGYPQIGERMLAVKGLVEEARKGVAKLDKDVKEQTTFANDLQRQLDETRKQAAAAAAAVKPAAPPAAASPAGGSSAADAAKIADFERQLQSSNAQVKDLEQKLKKSETELQSEKDAVKAANKKIADTEGILKTTKEDLAKANSTNSSGAGEIAQLKADLTAANDKAAKEEKFKKEAETREADVRKELATANSDIATLKGEVATLKAASSGPAAGGSAASGTAAQIGKLTSEKAALETKCNEETRLKVAAEKALKDATTEIGAKNQRISDLERDKATAEASVTNLTRDKNSLAAEKKTAEDAKKAAEDAKNKADAAAAKAAADLGTEQAKSARLQTHVTALEDWGEKMQGVAKQQYPVYQKITEYYGGLYKFQPPAAKQHLPPKPA